MKVKCEGTFKGFVDIRDNMVDIDKREIQTKVAYVEGMDVDDRIRDGVIFKAEIDDSGDLYISLVECDENDEDPDIFDSGSRYLVELVARNCLGCTFYTNSYGYDPCDEGFMLIPDLSKNN